MLAKIFVSLSLLLGTAVAQTHTGTMFNFAPGLGACGFTNTSAQSVASVSETVFNAFPGAGANPNSNPICKRKLFITANGVNASVSIVDFSEGGNFPNNIGVSPSVFVKFAPLDDGIVPNVTWVIV